MTQVKKTRKNLGGPTSRLGQYAINGGPGRPQGSSSGRVQALRLLDAILSRTRNLRTLERAMQEEFNKRPIRFFERYVMPLLPKNATQEKQGGIVCVVSEKFLPEPEKRCVNKNKNAKR